MASPQFATLGRSDLRVSRLCLGTMNFGNRDFGCDESTSVAIIDGYLGAGHNFIDTADVYAGTQSETIIGRALKGRRSDIVLATKAGALVGPGPRDRGASRRHLTSAIEGSLRRLDTDYIDLYQMHAYDDSTPLEETLGTLTDLVRAGKVRYVGVSNWSASQITEAALTTKILGWEPLVSLQPQYSILVRDIEVEIMPVCERFGLGIIPWSPLAGGMLSGKYTRESEPTTDTRFGSPGPFQEVWQSRNLRERNFAIVDVVVEEAGKLEIPPATLSLAWNLARPGVASPIVGPRSAQQLQQSLAALDVDLPEDTVDRIDRASEPHLPYPQNFSIRRGRDAPGRS